LYRCFGTSKLILVDTTHEPKYKRKRVHVHVPLACTGSGTGTPVASRVLGIELASVLGNIEACGSSGAATGVRRSTSTHYAVDKLAKCNWARSPRRTGEFYLLVVRATSVCKLTHPEKRHMHCIIRFRYTRPAPYRTLRFRRAASRDYDCPNWIVRRDRPKDLWVFGYHA
jgi:hypothetical protein